MTDFKTFVVIACGWILICLLIALAGVIERRKQ